MPGTPLTVSSRPAARARLVRQTPALLCLAFAAACMLAAAGQLPRQEQRPVWDAPAMAQASTRPWEGPWRDCLVTVDLPETAPADLRTHLIQAAAQVSDVAQVTYLLGNASASHDSSTGSLVRVMLVRRPTPLLTIPGSAAEATTSYTAGRRVGATIIIDLDAWTRLPEHGAGSRHQLLLHELLHTAGVGHADDRRSTMAPDLGTAVGITPDAARAAHAGAPTGCANGGT